MKEKLFKFICKLDKLSSRTFNKLKNKIKPLKDEKIPEFCTSAGSCSTGYSDLTNFRFRRIKT